VNDTIYIIKSRTVSEISQLVGPMFTIDREMPVFNVADQAELNAGV